MINYWFTWWKMYGYTKWDYAYVLILFFLPWKCSWMTCCPIWLKRSKICMSYLATLSNFIINSNVWSLDVKRCLWCLFTCHEFYWCQLEAQTCYDSWVVWDYKKNSQVMALKLQALLDKYDLRKKILAYVKDKGVNLGALTTILKCVINCEDFGGWKTFIRHLFWACNLLKACHYGTIDDKVGFHDASNQPRFISKITYHAKKIQQKAFKKDKGMFRCRPTTMEIEHIDEHCVIYIFFLVFLELIIKLTINLLKIYHWS